MLADKIKSFPNLFTQRLCLTQMQAKQAGEIALLRSNDAVNEFIDRAKTMDRKEAEKFIEKMNLGIANNQWLYWAITQNSSERLIGTTCLWNFSAERNSGEIGYELHPDFQKKGLMQEAVEAVLDYGFEEMKLGVIEAYVHPDNFNSIKLLGRNSFKYSGMVNNMAVYSLHKM